MVRSALLSSAALLAIAAFTTPANAACVEDPALSIACDGASGAQTLATDKTALTVQPGASVVSANRDAAAIAITGDEVTVTNNGLINQTDTRNTGHAIAVNADKATVTNNAGAVIRSGDRAIELISGSDLTVVNDGEIFSRRQGVRAAEGMEGATIINNGLISATNGRAAQLRGAGATVINNGVMMGGEEVIEAREDFTLVNHGLIALNGLSWDAATQTSANTGAKMDEDGIQFASGALHNHGVILSTDDGVDLDEGLVHNHRGGVIVSVGPNDVRSSGAVDVDSQFEPSTGSGDLRPAGPVTVINDGYMEGARGIVTDELSTAKMTILNTGTIYGRSGFAIDMSQDQGDTLVSLSGESLILGDILFGAGGVNTLALGAFNDGAGVSGAVSARAGGAFDVLFQDDFLRGDILAFSILDDLFELELKAGSDSFMLSLIAPASFTFGGLRYDADGFAAFLTDGSVAPVPLPAAGWLLLAGIGGLIGMRRRAA